MGYNLKIYPAAVKVPSATILTYHFKSETVPNQPKPDYVAVSTIKINNQMPSSCTINVEVQYVLCSFFKKTAGCQILISIILSKWTSVKIVESSKPLLFEGVALLNDQQLIF